MTSTRRSLTVLGALAAMLAASAGTALAQTPGHNGALTPSPVGFGSIRVQFVTATGSAPTAHRPGDQYQIRWEERASGDIIEGPDDDTHIVTHQGAAGSTLEYTITGLKHATRYLVNIRARGGSTGAWSAWRDNAGGTDGLQATIATTAVAPAVPVPTGVKVTAGDTSAMVEWGAVTDPTGEDIARYEWRAQSSTSNLDGHADGDDTSATIMGLNNGTEYTVSVRARATLAGSPDSGRASEYSEGVKVTPMEAPPEPEPLGEVQGLTATAGDRMLMLEWSPVAAAASYEWEAVGGGVTLTGSAAGTATGATIPNLTNGTEYTVRVRAMAAEDSDRVDGPWSTVTGTPVAPPAAPDPVTQVQSVEVTAGDRMLMVEWTAVADVTGRPIARYQWRVTGPDGYSGMGYSDTTEATIPGLLNGVEYGVSVRAQASMADGSPDPDRLGPWSSAVRGTPEAATDPEEPEEPTPTPALPLAGVLALFAGLLAAGRARLRR